MYKPALGNGIVKCKFQRDQQVIDTSGWWRTTWPCEVGEA
jgi:hypothetical protein